ncbi:RagB/SusD family nutrient uptake outer membrane protein [Hymenobacter sp. J193]|uniref:RagB/SusD family nutrient uptake outer membrane protein n=1 Tax=Hymenobacter sp. J193 TaxID=2898429 RepID=UPI0021509C87|nr:RagB/SusD family nutrient uptake outer membrane protein [Hymenobacter sp. J193]MCR5888952.1 RagB/SusD family nutrient uptake outer membrane protein [Hymenobacter sp. J193]
MKHTTLRRSAASLAFLLTLGLMSCEKQLDIDPQQSVDAATALDTPEGVESAIIGAYARMDLPESYGTNLLLLADLFGSDANYLTWQGTFQSYREVTRKEMTSGNSEADRTWSQNYQTINLANLVLDATSVVKDDYQKNLIEGEAHMVRGMLYFELVRLYAQPYQTKEGDFSNVASGVPAPNSTPGVPLNLTPNKTEEQASKRLARATVEEVYAQVLSDLTTAETMLPDPNEGTDTRRFDLYDAKAMLARVYLQMGRYEEALAKANEVIEGSGAILNSSVISTFTNKNSSEVLFEIQQNDQNNAGGSNDGLATFYSSNIRGFGGRGDVRVSAPFAAKYEDGDQRGFADQIGSGLIYVGDGSRAGVLRSYKWNTASQNIPILRLSEMYLIRAEANVRLGTAVGEEPYWDVNRLRLRAQADTLNPIKVRDADGNIINENNPNYGTITLADVLNERDLELAFEGFRLHDYKRTGRSIGGLTVSSPRLVLPVPLYETNLGNALPQNEGY